MIEALRRNMMVQIVGGEIKLPPEYQQVEYLENTGSSYLFIPEDIDVLHSTFEIEFEPASNAGTDAGVFGNATYFYMMCEGDSPISLRLNTWSPSIHYGKGIEWRGKRTKIKFVCDAPNFYGKLEMDGVVYEKSITSNIQSQTKTGYYIFFIGSYYRMIGKIYSFFIDGVKQYNLIPCYRKTDNEAGMYDIVNNVFYTNAGTGEFLVGADVN